MERIFRTLRADEIECRVATISAKGLSLLLYKDARVDQNILDETVGPGRWQRTHELINGNLFCNVGILFDYDNGQSGWVWKQDVGTESNTEKEKGQASDAFKRACFNWGIGRELYTAPFIWIPAAMYTATKGKNGNDTTYDRFSVKWINIEDGTITGLAIVNTKTNKTVYTYGRQAKPEASQGDGTDIGPVTNETIRRATQQTETDNMKLCGEIELATLEALTHTAFPKADIHQIFPAFPQITREQYGIAVEELIKRIPQAS